MQIPMEKKRWEKEASLEARTEEDIIEDPLLVEDKEMLLPTRQSKCGKRRDQMEGLQNVDNLGSIIGEAEMEMLNR